MSMRLRWILFREWLRVVVELPRRLRALSQQLDESAHYAKRSREIIEAVMRDVRNDTQAVVDIGRNSSFVILLTRRNDQDYIRCYEMSHDDARGLAGHLDDLADRARTRRVDAPPSFRGVLSRDRWT